MKDLIKKTLRILVLVVFSLCVFIAFTYMLVKYLGITGFFDEV